MMKRCDRCGKPLTEFETNFHREAGSPPAISEKCWICSGGEMQFLDGYADKPHHKVEIFVCLLAIALIVVLFLPALPYLNETELPTYLIYYEYVLVTLYAVIGAIATAIIHRLRGKKPTLQQWDPPLTRYQHTYGPNTDIYTTTQNRNGDFVTTKETRLGGSVDDRWGDHASSGSAWFDGISNFYAKLFSRFLTTCIFLLIGCTFAFWVIPYILVMIVRDRIALQNTRNIPKPLQRAYRHCRQAYGTPPISYSDKAGFLVSRENHKTKKAEQKNSFLSHYQQSATDDSAPYFYTRKPGVSYMIVDYQRPQNKNYGVSFLLVAEDGESLKKRIVVGDGFVPTDPCNWEQDWNEAGVSLYAKQHLEWYEKKMNAILKSSKKNKDIVG